MQSDPVVSKASELLRLGLMPTAEQIRNGKVDKSLFHLNEGLLTFGLGYPFN